MMEVDDQLNSPRLPQRWIPSLNWRNNTWRRQRKERRRKERQLLKTKHNYNNNKEEKFKFNRPKWPNVNVVTHNIRGCSKNQLCKLDHISNMINKQDTPTIYLIQETWMSKDDVQNINDILFISHGYEKEPDEVRSANGGVCIALSKAAQKAWKRAGQPDPITSKKLAKTARNIGLELHI